MKRIQEHDERDGWYEISPTECAIMLEMREKNRPLREARARHLSEAIPNWSRNGEPVIINGNGKVIDGQHRLRASVLADHPLVTYVIHLEKTDIKTFDSIDQGITRRISDVLALNDVRHYALQAAMVRHVITYENKESEFVTYRITPSEARIRRAKDGREFDDVADFITGKDVKHGLEGMMPHSVAGFVLFMARKYDRKAADSFIMGVATGAELSKSNPALILRNRLLDESKRASILHTREHAAFAILAWNAYYHKRPLKIIRWTKTQQFPRFQP